MAQLIRSAARACRPLSTSAPATPSLTHVRDILAQQPFNQLLGIELVDLSPGACTLSLDARRRELTQHHGFVHAGALATLADNAGGCAAATQLPPSSSVVSVEFKINLLAPSRGDSVTAAARVVRAGKRLITTLIEVHSHTAGKSELTALCTQTIAAVPATRGPSNEIS